MNTTLWRQRMVRKTSPLLVLVCLIVWFAGFDASRAATPDVDQWNTEALSAKIDAELKKLGELLTESKGDFQRQAELLAKAGVRTSIPTSRIRVFSDSQVVVERATSQRQQIGDLREFRVAITKTLGAIREGKLDFKITGIASKSDYLEATSLVAFHGKSDKGRFEQNAVWETRWTTDASTPRLREIEVLTLEEVHAHSSNGKPIFRDCTSNVFHNVASYRDQLAFGQAHWQRRIESFHGILNQAQNGLSIGDVNGDGLDDVYVSQPGGLPNRLYIHQPNGRVRDISGESGADILDNTHGSLLVDFDNDGDQDLILATAPALLLFDNDGRARFTLKAAVNSVADAYSLAAADYDHDGDLDIFACGYFPPNAQPDALPVPVPYFDARNGAVNHLLENQGDWRIVDVTEKIGLGVDNRRFSYAAAWLDYDKDGDQDLYIANDFGPDKLYRNDRLADGCQFVDVSEASGIQQGAFGMSVSVGDFDRNGFDDVYVANMFSSAGSRVTHQAQFRPADSSQQRLRFRHLAAGNALLANLDGKMLRDVGPAAGVTMGRWSWGSNFIDINNDGWQDLIVGNGYITGPDPNDL